MDRFWIGCDAAIICPQSTAIVLRGLSCLTLGVHLLLILQVLGQLLGRPLWQRHGVRHAISHALSSTQTGCAGPCCHCIPVWHFPSICGCNLTPQFLIGGWCRYLFESRLLLKRCVPPRQLGVLVQLLGRLPAAEACQSSLQQASVQLAQVITPITRHALRQQNPRSHAPRGDCTTSHVGNANGAVLLMSRLSTERPSAASCTQ